jgi:soluble lytic murein transglycosylase
MEKSKTASAVFSTFPNMYRLLLLATLVSLEFLPPADFDAQVTRFSLTTEASTDSSLSPLFRELAKANAFFYQGRCDSAEVLYTAQEASAPAYLQEWILTRRSQCRVKAGDWKGAEELLRPHIALSYRTDSLLVEALLADTSFADSARLDSVASRVATAKEPYKTFLRLQQAQILERQKKSKESVKIWLELVGKSGEVKDSAVSALLRLAPDTRNLDFALALCAQGNKRCLPNTNALLKAGKMPKADLPKIWEAQANAYRNLGKNDSAILRYRQLIDSVEAKSGWMQSLVRLLKKRGHKDAKKMDSLFKEKFAYSTERAANLWVEALELEQAGKHKKAIEGFTKLANPKFGKNRYREWARFRVGLIQFKQGHFKSAAQSFRTNAKEVQSAMAHSA